MTRNLVLAFATVFVISALAPAQEEAEAPRRSRNQDNVEKRQDLTISYYPLKNPLNSAQELTIAASRIWGRSFRVDDGGRLGNGVTNIFAMGNAVAVFDTPDQVGRILAELPKMESAFGSPPTRQELPKLETQTFALHYISAMNAMTALQVYMRKIPTSPGGKSGVTNITAMQERNLLVVRETPETLREIAKVLTNVDVEAKVRPQPPITFACYVLAATNERMPGQGLPPELAENLPKLVPYHHFKTLGTGMLRASSSSRNLSLNMGLADDFQCTLELAAIRYDADTEAVTLGHCNFSLTEPSNQRFTLSTSTDIRSGEYTVIGALGDTPYFFVLRATTD